MDTGSGIVTLVAGQPSKSGKRSGEALFIAQLSCDGRTLSEVFTRGSRIARFVLRQSQVMECIHKALPVALRTNLLQRLPIMQAGFGIIAAPIGCFAQMFQCVDDV